MSKPLFSEVWKLIVSYEGEEFRTITNLPFTYQVNGNSLTPSRTHYNISRADFVTAYNLVPISSPGEITKLVRGP